MNYKAWSVYAGLAAFVTPAVAQVDLTAYANKDGYIDVQAPRVLNSPTPTRKTPIT